MGRSRRALTLPEPPRGLVIFCVRGVVSPLLANVYLHYAFDLWAQHWREHRATGDVIIVRYADDIVMGFEQRADAARFAAEDRKRRGEGKSRRRSIFWDSRTSARKTRKPAASRSIARLSVSDSQQN